MLFYVFCCNDCDIRCGVLNRSRYFVCDTTVISSSVVSAKVACVKSREAATRLSVFVVICIPSNVYSIYSEAIGDISIKYFCILVVY